MVIDDKLRWDLIHKKTHKGPEVPHSHYAEEKEKLFPRNSLVVDIGGGTGEDAAYFLNQGHAVVLLDISTFALQKASEKAKSLNLSEKLVTRQTDYGLHALPIKDSSVDVIYSRIALNYFDAEHTARLFHDINRILKPKAKAYISMKSPDDRDEMEYLEKMTVLFEPNVFIENGMLRSRFTIEQLKAILNSAGITNADVHLFDEEIGDRREGHKQILHLNEVVFAKI